ncbi:hypothetical protein RZA67_15780 [Stenotrophomonas sp. C3(2023)]|uniref:hypothetical protein n=1 Tax=Stenotrophomonas sp. C3(2023) TaxID=3080277 RepID=UPI00293C94F3|nr:hypothetical protein [Stenotrophomonas sp. C3(2023)]MDV3470182.1 hypothetical protein [Stenotrophomonas sp. C3(2023)]
MLELIVTSFNFSDLRLSELEIREHSNEVFDAWARDIEERLLLPDYSIALVVEEGSIKGKGKILVAATALYGGICSYGSFVSGVETIARQASAASDFLYKNAQSAFNCTSPREGSRRHSGEAFYMKKILDRVSRGQISAEHAAVELSSRWEKLDPGNSVSLHDLAAELTTIPRDPQQLELDTRGWPDCEGKPPKVPQPRKPPNDNGNRIDSHLRIEISKASRRDPKRIWISRV